MLRCEKTGKLFFTTKEAELHGEETGFKDFSQVSLEEKIWICAETKKVCFNEQQMDIHKKRVPEAVTWEEKTVADLKAEQDKKATASSSDVTDMETEEDVLLRAAGKAPKGKGKVGAAGRRHQGDGGSAHRDGLHRAACAEGAREPRTRHRGATG